MKPAYECKNIEEVRTGIDCIDKEIISLIAKRFGYVKEVVKYKKKDKDSIIAQERYDAVIKNRRDLAIENGLDPDIIETVYRTLMNYFINEELKLIK